MQTCFHDEMCSIYYVMCEENPYGGICQLHRYLVRYDDRIKTWYITVQSPEGTYLMHAEQAKFQLKEDW
jgi:hypothetical protein